MELPEPYCANSPPIFALFRLLLVNSSISHCHFSKVNSKEYHGELSWPTGGKLGTFLAKLMRQKSHTGSSHSDDLHHKQLAPDANPKVTHFTIPNVISNTNNVVTPPATNCQVVHIVDSPAPDHGKQIDIEHPKFDRVSARNDIKGKEVATHSESSTGRPTITYEDLFPEIVAHSLQLAYRF
eukprot:Gb_07200 [translate_table: standard]